MRPPGSPRQGVPGRLHIRAAGERPPRARPQRRGSPGPIPNPAVKPAFAESTAAPGCGRAGRRARGGRFSISAEEGPQGRLPAGLSAFGVQVFAWRSFNLNAAILVSRYRRPIRALEALARSALCGFLSRARRLLTARAAIHLPAASGSWPPDRPSVAHGGSPCGISLQFDDALTVALALFRVRLARWVLARLCSFVLTP